MNICMSNEAQEVSETTLGRQHRAVQPIEQRAHGVADHLLVEALLAAEVVADHRHVGIGALGDQARGDLVVFVGEEAVERRLEQPRPDRIARFVHRILHCAGRGAD
jgi:hypothetical protein